MTNDIINVIFQTFEAQGHRDYGEQVTMLEHMLQTAHFAEQDQADPILIAAAVLHDYGHFIHNLPDDIADQGIDGLHEEVGAEYLSEFFPAEVTEPIRLHVAAKRYLCAKDPEYLAGLSAASLQSLQLQGGPFSPGEAADFEKSRHFENAIRLRRYDEMGKVIDMTVPDLEHYRPYLEAALNA